MSHPEDEYEVDDDYGDEWYDYDEDDEGEPIGSCDNCDCNLYEDDCWHLDGMQFCNQCYWYATGGEPPDDDHDD